MGGGPPEPSDLGAWALHETSATTNGTLKTIRMAVVMLLTSQRSNEPAHRLLITSGAATWRPQLIEDRPERLRSGALSPVVAQDSGCLLLVQIFELWRVQEGANCLSLLIQGRDFCPRSFEKAVNTSLADSCCNSQGSRRGCLALRSVCVEACLVQFLWNPLCQGQLSLR